VAAKEHIVYQPYVRGARGAVKPGTPVPCRTAEEGLRRAEKALASASVVGAHVVRVMADEEAGDYGNPEYLASLGTVPNVD
jgi:hypothetical protein